MKLDEYIKSLCALAEKYPDAQIVAASDDEGNDFSPVAFEPSAGFYADREFIPHDSEDFDPDDHEVNAVCLN